MKSLVVTTGRSVHVLSEIDITSCWDIALHYYGAGQHIASQWYTITCISLDVLMASICLVRFEVVMLAEKRLIKRAVNSLALSSINLLRS